MATTISIPAMLTHELVDRLAALSDQENGVAEIALSALDAESLALLGKCGVIEEVDTSGDEAGEIVITAYGRQVIDECAAARDDSSAGASDSSARVPATLTDELVDRLAALADQPEGVAEVALSALRYGSLASLMAHGVIEPIDTSGDEAGEILITNYGRQLIEACAELRRHVMQTDRLVTPDDSAGNDALSALGSAFLLQDSAATAFQLGAVAQFEGPVPPFEEILAHAYARLGAIPRFRQKLASPLAGLIRQRWVDDPTFDIKHHVRQTQLRDDGGRGALEELVAEIFSSPLDRARPLWEVWVVEGLEHGGFAVITKTHYAVLERFSGVDLVTLLYELTPKALEPPPRATSQARDEPSSRELVASSVGEAIRTAAALPFHLVSAAGTPARAITQVRYALGQIASVSRVAAARLKPAPPSPMNVPIGSDRRVAFVDVPLSDIRAVKKASGGSVMDIVLTLVTASLRSWLHVRDAGEADLVLKAAVISAGQGRDEGPLSARMTQAIISLPTDEMDPAARLARVQEATQQMRGALMPDPAEDRGVPTVRELAGPTILAFVLRLAMSSRLYNLVVANIPGSGLPLYMLGRRMQTLRPMTFLTQNHALTVAVMRYDDQMCFSVIGDSEALPDVNVVAGGITDALQELCALKRPRKTRRRAAQIG
jgi:diacylglycerol O-acyltransferase